jgi:hypothetical protein
LPKIRNGILPVALVAAGIFLVGCEPALDQRPFDRAAWMSADVDASHTRKQMVRDLLQDHPLKGMRRAEVLALLGPAERTDKWADYDLIYVLGPQGIDFDWLIIKLGPDGKVRDYAVVSD